MASKKNFEGILKMKVEQPKFMPQVQSGGGILGKGWHQETIRHKNAKLLGWAGGTYATKKKKNNPNNKKNFKKKIFQIIEKAKPIAERIGDVAEKVEEKARAKLKEMKLEEEQKKQLEAIRKGEVMGLKKGEVPEAKDELQEVERKAAEIGKKIITSIVEGIKSTNPDYVRTKLTETEAHLETISEQIGILMREGVSKEDIAKVEKLQKERENYEIKKTKLEIHLKNLERRAEFRKERAEKRRKTLEKLGREAKEIVKEVYVEPIGEVLKEEKEFLVDPIEEEIRGFFSKRRVEEEPPAEAPREEERELEPVGEELFGEAPREEPRAEAPPRRTSAEDMYELREGVETEQVIDFENEPIGESPMDFLERKGREDTNESPMDFFKRQEKELDCRCPKEKRER